MVFTSNVYHTVIAMYYGFHVVCISYNYRDHTCTCIIVFTGYVYHNIIAIIHALLFSRGMYIIQLSRSYMYYGFHGVHLRNKSFLGGFKWVEQSMVGRGLKK